MADWRTCPVCGGDLVPRPIGGRDRRQCDRCKWIHWDAPIPVVIVLAATASGKVLYARSVGWPPGHWGLISGFVEQGESLEAAALREVEEESALAPRNARVVGSASWRNEILAFVTVDIDDGLPRPSAEPDLEAVELADADPARIPEIHPAHQFLAAWLANKA